MISAEEINWRAPIFPTSRRPALRGFPVQSPIDFTQIKNIITAIAALGTASFGLVDATKAFGGGASRFGLAFIRRGISPVFGKDTDEDDRSTPLTFGSIYATLKANWLNGVDLADQKAKAKTLLKLRLNPGNSEDYAKATGVDPKELKTIANLIQEGGALETPQADAFGRFDLALTALLDEGYQRADQRYRNWAKILAGIFSVVIAVAAAWLLGFKSCKDMATAALAGALAMPLAPIAKDLTSALAAGVDVVQKMQKKP